MMYVVSHTRSGQARLLTRTVDIPFKLMTSRILCVDYVEEKKMQRSQVCRRTTGIGEPVA